MRLIFSTLVVTFAISNSAVVGQTCTGCFGDVGIKLSDSEFWGESPPSQYSKHVHNFGSRCDAANLPGQTSEVHIMIEVAADLDGTTRYVTANFVSGTEVTAITSGNGFMDAPSDGKFFKDDGTTACSGETNKTVVRLAHDDFNALLAAGDGTMKIEVLASDDVEDVCSLCCESGHAWTPDECCSGTPPCSCPPGVGSKSEVTLVYLDCKVIGDLVECDDDTDCTDDGDFCNGDEVCSQTGQCVHSGNPCIASGKLCCLDCDPQQCVDCDSPAIFDSCEDQEGNFCNGVSTCDTNQSPAVCVGGTAPCSGSEDCLEDVDACLGCTP